MASVGISGIAGGTISGTVSGLAAGTMNGLVNYSMSGDANVIWKSALIGTGIGALSGAIGGMIDALSSGKNVWLGKRCSNGSKCLEL